MLYVFFMVKCSRPLFIFTAGLNAKAVFKKFQNPGIQGLGLLCGNILL